MNYNIHVPDEYLELAGLTPEEFLAQFQPIVYTALADILERVQNANSNIRPTG